MKFVIFLNDRLYKSEAAKSVSFASVFGQAELLPNHADMFSRSVTGVVTYVDFEDKTHDLVIFDGLFSFFDGNEVSLITNRVFDLENISSDEKKSLINELRNRKDPNFESIIAKISGNI